MAAFVTDIVDAWVFNPATADDRFELLWIRSNINESACYIGALYHPPASSKVSYAPHELINHLRDTLDVIIAGDFNQLSDSDLCDLGLINIVGEPTHQGHKLDRIYSTSPMYAETKVVNTEHKAIIAQATLDL